MKPVLKYGNVPGKNVLEFPRSFLFFDFLGKKSPSIAPLQELKWVFLNVQISIFPLLPFFCRKLFYNEGNGILANMFTIFITYQTYNDIITKNYVSVLGILILSLCIFVFSFLCFQYFKNTGTLPLWVNLIHEFLFNIHPMNLLFPIILSIAFDSYNLLTNPAIQVLSLTSLLISALLFIALLIFTYWALPIYYSSQFQFRHNITTTIPYGNGLFWTILAYFLLALFTVSAKNDVAILEAEVVICIYSLYKTVIVWVKPCNNPWRFLAVMSSHIVASIFSVLIMTQVYLKYMKEIYFAIMIVCVWIFVLIVTALLIRWKHVKTDRMIESSNFSKSSVRDILYICQRALYTSKLSKNIISMMDEAYFNDQSPSNMISLVALQIAYDVHRQDLDTMVTELANTPNLPRITQFLVYQLYKRYTNSSKLVCLLSGVDTIDRRIQEFKNLSDKFWKASMHGQAYLAVRRASLLKNLLDDMCYDFRLYEAFFPSHSKVHTLYNEFFKKFIIRNETKVSDINRYSINDNDIMMSVSDNSDGSTSVHSSSSSNSDEELRNGQQQWISENIKKLAQKPLSLAAIFIISLIWIATIAVYYTIMKWKQVESTNHQTIPKILYGLQLLTTQWLKISYMLDAFWANTSLSNMRCWEIRRLSQLPHEAFTSSTMTIFRNMSTILHDLQNDLSQTEYEVIRLDPKDVGYKGFKKNLFHPRVNLTNYTISLDQFISSTASYLMSIKSQNQNLTKDELYEALMEIWPTIFESDRIVAYQMNTALYELKVVFEARKEGSSNFTKLYVIIQIGVMLFCLLATFTITLCIVKYFCRIIAKHFRPSQHPNQQIEIELSETVDKGIWSLDIFIFFVGYIFIIAIFIGLYFLMIYALNDTSHEIIRYGESLIAIQNLTHKIGSLENHLVALPENSSVNLSEYQSEINTAATTMMHTLQAKFFKSYRSDILFEHLMNYSCVINNESHIADIFSCYSSTVTYNFLTYFTSRMTEEQNISRRDFAHTQYLYLDSILQDLQLLAGSIVNLSSYTVNEYQFIDRTKYAFFTCFALFTFIVFYELLFTLYVIENQLGRQIAALSPLFIIQHQCLVSYVADLTETEASQREVLPFFEIYDSSGVAVVALDDKLSIIAFTREVLKIFGYKAQQLYGQNIETLVPMTEKIWKNNDKKFYRQIELARNHEAASMFSRTVTGCCSDRTPIDLKTSVSYVETTSGKYFVIEFRSIARETFYEEQYINSSKLINQYRSSAMPIMLFTEDSVLNRSMSFKDTVKVRYRHYAAVYIGLIIDENFELPDLNESSFSPMKDILSITTPLYSGVSGALVIDATCETALVIFVNDEDNDAHLHNAIGFSLDFSEKNIYPTHGVIIDGDDLDVCLHPLPDVNEKPGSKQIRPQMSIEPQSDIMVKLSKVIQLAIENCLILPTSAAELISDVPSVPFSNDLGLDLSFIEIKISSYVSN